MLDIPKFWRGSFLLTMLSLAGFLFAGLGNFRVNKKHHHEKTSCRHRLRGNSGSCALHDHHRDSAGRCQLSWRKADSEASQTAKVCDTGQAADTNAETDQDTEANAETDADADPNRDAKADGDQDAETDSDAKADQDTEADAKTDSKATMVVVVVRITIPIGWT